MSPQDSSELLGNLHDPSWGVSQAAALRLLKHKLLGHEQQKEQSIRSGIVPYLARTFAANVGGDGHRAGPPTKEDEEARLQATIIVGSLALGGPAFIDPLLSASIVPSLLTSLNPADASPQLVLETLRTLNAIADALSLTLPLSSSSSAFHEPSLSDTLFASAHVESLTKVLRQTSGRSIVQQQVSQAACLIAKTCRDERHRSTLARLGVLDALGARLASFVVATGFVLPSHEHEPHGVGAAAAARVPKPAPPTAELYPILDAIASIIHASKFRASQLLYGPQITAVLPLGILGTADVTRRRADSGPNSVHASSLRRRNLIDYILPQTTCLHHKFTSAHAHSVSAYGSVLAAPTVTNGQPHPSDARAFEVGYSVGGDEDESPLVAWLIVLARREHGINRLMALALLAELSRVGLVSKSRTCMLALVVVPLLVRMLDDSATPTTQTPAYPPSNDPEWVQRTVKERGPAILAMLVTDSGELQKAAVDADAIKKLSTMLKAAYHPAPDSQRPSSWTPRPDNTMADAAEPPRDLRLADPGLSPALIHKLRVRESTLLALAALAPFRDEHRRMIIDNGVTTVLLESLKPYEEKALSASNQATYGSALAKVMRSSSALIGNPVPVLVAACALVRALSRSVSILRTSLIDAGIALPLFNLLSSPDIEVQIAATAVVCNLVLEFSPMRETIMQAGVLKILCAHAHSPNPRLRLNAVWALKHLVFKAENTVKVSCLRELGHGWLIQLISGSDSETVTTGIEAVAPSSAEDGASLMYGSTGSSSQEPLASISSFASQELPTSDMMDEDSNVNMAMMMASTGDNDEHDSPPPGARADSNGVEMSGIDTTLPAELATATTMDAKLAALREAEMDPSTKARRDEVAVQEQGLDFIRNIICGSKSEEIEEMIDFLFESFGRDRLFGILASKLRIRMVKTSPSSSSPAAATTAATRSSNSYTHLGPLTSNGHDQTPPYHQAVPAPKDAPSETRLMLSQPEIIVAVCFILVDIAAGHPRHRQMLIQQTSLLKQLVPLFGHPSKQVRAALAWIVINLTWVDDPTDKMACRDRALELKRLGFQTGLEGIVKDCELDVKERSKTALFQLKDLVGRE